MNRPFDLLVEYYRDRLAAPHPVIPGWTRFFEPIGAGYRQNNTGIVLSAALALRVRHWRFI